MNPTEISEEAEYDDLQNILDQADDIVLDLLPEKSKIKYVAVYEKFMSWRDEKNLKNEMCEEVLLVYVNKLIKEDRLKPPTVWSRYSMLKSTLLSYENIDIKKYEKVIAYLKKHTKGYRPKKAKIFTAEDITNFCTHAPDDTHLIEKVILILGMAGGLRRVELYDLVMDNITENDNVLKFSIPSTKNGEAKSFVVMGELRHIINKYRALRPARITTNKFLINYQKGKCTTQVIGINKIGAMPKRIADFLKLPDAQLYTGHSFRRTSATLLIDAGADITELKRFGGWKSTAVAEGYLGESMNNKKRTYSKITESINVTASTSKKQYQMPAPPTTSTSKDPLKVDLATSTPENKENKPAKNRENPSTSTSEHKENTGVFQFHNCTVHIVHNNT